MKRFYLICTLFLFVFGLSASEVLISLNRSSTSNSVVTSYKDEYYDYLVSIGETENGFNLTAPASFSFHANNWYIGEVKRGGLFSYLLNPTEKAFVPGNSESFQKISTTSIEPAFSGIAKTFSNSNFAVMSPVFSRSSPFGLYGDCYFQSLYAGSLYMNYPYRTADKYLMDWDDVFKSGINVYGIVGYSDTLKTRFAGFDFSAFLQSVYRETFGLTGTVGWNAKIKRGSYYVSGYRRISDNSSETPSDEFGYSLSFDNIVLKYTIKTFGMPEFGGMAQRKSVEFGIGCSFGFFSYSATGKIEAEEYTGTVSTTTYELDYKDKETSVDCELLLNRSQNTLENVDVSVKLNDCKFCIKEAKYSVIISYSDVLMCFNQPVYVKMSVDQNREVILSAKLNLY